MDSHLVCYEDTISVNMDLGRIKKDQMVTIRTINQVDKQQCFFKLMISITIILKDKNGLILWER